MRAVAMREQGRLRLRLPRRPCASRALRISRRRLCWLMPIARRIGVVSSRCSCWKAKAQRRHGRVEHARNAQGEHVALKLLADPQRHGAESDEEHARRVRAARRRLSASMNATRSFRA